MIDQQHNHMAQLRLRNNSLLRRLMWTEVALIIAIAGGILGWAR